MDPNVPKGAAKLLDLIGDTETGKKAPEAYGVIFGHRQGRLSKPLTEHTVDELLDAQKAWARNWGGSAAGRYQIIRKTMLGLKAELKLKGSQHFDANLQDRLGFHLLVRRKYADFVSRRLTVIQFGKLLAQEWASFPVLEDTQGATRKLDRGQSYYAGDGLNKSLIRPEAVEAILMLIRTGPPDVAKPDTPAEPLPPATERPTGRGGVFALIIGGLLALAGAIFAFFQNGGTTP